MFRREEVTPGVWRLLMARRLFGRDLYPAACYVVPGGGIIVDSGTALFADQTVEAARGAGVRSALLTHAHEDHTGGIPGLASKLGASCFAHRDAIPALADPRFLRMLPYRRFLFGVPKKCAAQPLGESFETDGVRFRVLHGPGHAPDHVVFFDEKKGWLFVGDVYIPTKDNVFFGIGCDLASWIRTLRTLAGLDAGMMFTGMGVVSRRPSRALTEKADRYSDICGKVKLLRGQGLHEGEIAARLFPGDFCVRLVTGGDFSAVNFVRACLRGS